MESAFTDLVNSLKDELLGNLLRHVRSCEDNTEASETYDSHQCKAEEAEIQKRYREMGVADVTFSQIRDGIESSLFSETRYAVHAALTQLKSSDPEQQRRASTELFNMFSPFDSRKSSHAAKYFEEQGGMDVLVNLVTSTWSHYAGQF